ncbi:DUF4062 domain-containing protein [Bacillus subtilis]|uniref:DUF4062 domain-containing protein n=1 Tax=Bacillus subtilis TaxID=1423 RepID=UPI000F540DDE|nr:DUF4062 domain-containing protein [Bacillus subtilis]MCT6513403.1 DUF4062 domain-containing protein [Bacillus subtilis]MCX4076724.1 DUF4062 domain-containing protein [Bacillus subtilis]MEC0435511.1 DUF4062 domain-containing protein [Bacillus subtilis]RPK03001.1 hypothetical protein EH11_02332 [Bacillus subtilis]RUS09211.1 hypothetical protein EFW59_02340 [Bacillus subtilis]
MNKRLQVFISSTYTDLTEERQAAVAAVLNAGHIPAGMELFKSGDQSQKETIKNWIDESDVYMLILGGRYGSIDEETNKSYTHWEYDYAESVGKPRFSIVISDEALDKKVKEKGQDVIEREHYSEYRQFKDTVLSKVSKFYSDTKDIELAVFASLKEYEKDEKLVGWVSGNGVESLKKVKEENYSLLKENSIIKEKLAKLEKKFTKENEFDGYSYKDILTYLNNIKLSLPDINYYEEVKNREQSLFKLFYVHRSNFTIGVENSGNMREYERFLFFDVAPKLIPFNLLEKNKVAAKPYQRIQLSKNGQKFIAKYEMENLIK